MVLWDLLLQLSGFELPPQPVHIISHLPSPNLGIDIQAQQQQQQQQINQLTLQTRPQQQQQIPFQSPQRGGQMINASGNNIAGKLFF